MKLGKQISVKNAPAVTGGSAHMTGKAVSTRTPGTTSPDTSRSHAAFGIKGGSAKMSGPNTSKAVRAGGTVTSAGPGVSDGRYGVQRSKRNRGDGGIV